MKNDLRDFPVVVSIPVAWGDMDAFSHVNNVMYFRYVETSRIAYFERSGIPSTDTKGIGPILASTACRYRAPVTFPDTLDVGARVREVGEDRLFMEYALFSRKAGRLVATAEAVVVSYDYAMLAKVPVPTAWRTAIDALETQTVSKSSPP